MTVRIISTGISLVQDNGRSGYQDMGVPRSGALDQVSYRLANMLIGSSAEPVFEILSGPLMLRTDKPLLFAVTGEAVVKIGSSKAASQTAQVLKAGEDLTVTSLGPNPAYISIAGLTVPKTLGSSSFDTLSGLGYPQLKAGDEFEVSTVELSNPQIGAFSNWSRSRENPVIHFLAGPHKGNLSGSWKVASISRTGIRLFGNDIKTEYSSSLASFPVFPGSIQIPPSGEPVILGPDCGTTGGYPVAGRVITADLHRLASLGQGQIVYLESVDLDFAIKAKANLDRELSQAVIRPSSLGLW